MLEVYKLIGQAAPQTISVLIRGESGTGKELVARAIYHHSGRAQKPFLAINCAAIPENLLESNFLATRKAPLRRRFATHWKIRTVFRGNDFSRRDRRHADHASSKILRLLQDQQFERVGGSQTIQTDVRLIAATNRDLESMIKSGDFREDLYYRLNGVTIFLPPLRDRIEDIELLLKYFLRRFAKELSKEVTTYSHEALQLLQGYSWPGNVREMQAVLRRRDLALKGPGSDCGLSSSRFSIAARRIPDLLPLRFSESTGDRVGEVHRETDQGTVSNLFMPSRLNFWKRSRSAGYYKRLTATNHKPPVYLESPEGVFEKIAAVGISIAHVVSVDES